MCKFVDICIENCGRVALMMVWAGGIASTLQIAFRSRAAETDVGFSVLKEFFIALLWSLLMPFIAWGVYEVLRMIARARKISLPEDEGCLCQAFFLLLAGIGLGALSLVLGEGIRLISWIFS